VSEPTDPTVLSGKSQPLFFEAQRQGLAAVFRLLGPGCSDLSSFKFIQNADKYIP
jgi:hypothetical protein